MRALAAAIAVLTLAGCASYPAEPYTLETTTPGAELAFMSGESGHWSLSPVPPRAPYNQERPPSRLTAVWGTGTEAPFACGLTAVKGSYWSGSRGRLNCAIGDDAGRVRVEPIGSGVYREAFDAVRGRDGLSVVADRFGGEVELINLAHDGRIMGVGRLPHDLVAEQAVLLPSGRLAVLRRDPETRLCAWAVYSFETGAPREVSQTPADNCAGASSGGDVLRDQVTGQAYFLTRAARPGMARLDETPAGLIAVPIDIHALPLDSTHGEARAPVILDGVMYFLAGYGEDRGAVIGLYDLRTKTHRRLAFPGPGPETADEAAYVTAANGLRLRTGPSRMRQLMGFLAPASPGQPPRLVLRSTVGPVEVIDLDLAAAVPVA